MSSRAGGAWSQQAYLKASNTGEGAGEIDAWVPDRTHDNDYWHVTGLANGPHTVRIVARADTDVRSKGRLVRIDRAIVYGPRP